MLVEVCQLWTQLLQKLFQNDSARLDFNGHWKRGEKEKILTFKTEPSGKE